MQLGHHFPCLNFPDSLNRARRNTVDIFPEIKGDIVNNFQALKYDRSLIIKLEKSDLLLKMHGRRGNVILYDSSGENKIFIQSLQNDLNSKPNDLAKPIPTKEVFTQSEGNVKKLFPVLGGKLMDKLYSRGYFELDIERKWVAFNEYLKDLESLRDIYINGENEELALELFPEKGKSVLYKDPLKAMNDFYYKKVSFDRLQGLKAQLLREGEKRLSKLKNYILKLNYKLGELEKADPNKYYADVIMSQIFQLKGKTQHEVTLIGFEGEEIHLNFKGKPAASVAENFYRKSKNRQIEIDTLNKNIRTKTLQADALENDLEIIHDITELKDLKKYQKETKLNTPEDTRFHRFEKEGFVILVGKNARNNDLLTFKNSFKEDLWLHAKDVPGSHVLIKYKSGQNFPRPVIEYAAGLAAFYSKRKTESVVPVTVTPRKFVRKRKGDPPGLVIVEKEDVLLVTPQY